MKKLAIVLTFLLCSAAAFAGDHKNCDMAKAHHTDGKTCDMAKGKTAEMTGRIFMKDNARYFQAEKSDTAYPVCEHSKADISKLGDDVNVRVKAKIINCADDNKEKIFIESADKI